MDVKGIIEVIRSGVPGIQILGQDLNRIDEEIEAAVTPLGFKLKEWNLGYGWVDFKTKRALKPDQEVLLYQDLKTIADDDPTGRIYVIQNAYSVLKDDIRAIARLQQELLRIKRHFKGRAAIILVAKENIEFPELVNLLIPFSCSPLSLNQVDEIFCSLLNEYSISVTTSVRDSLNAIFSGMERDMVFQVFETLRNKYKDKFPQESVGDALAMKKRELSRSGLLELVDSKIDIDQIGGLEQLKSWLRNKKYIIEHLPQAQKLGISPPKGVLLAGMPGCGKSMSAKAASSLFNVPLFRLDIGSLMGKFVGESEANMKAALKVAEQASPCVLWIDELEKAFSGINGAGGSAEITTRLFGYFLTWMQEKPGAVFVIATANDITNIPPELLRRGRFDEIFYVNLPSERERKQIFHVKTKQLKTTPRGLDLAELATLSEGFSGADIECVVNDALESLFRSNESILTQALIKKHIDLITPISIVLKEKISIYQALFEKFSLKAASLADEDLDSIDALSDSNALPDRENAASNEFISSEKLIELVNDQSPLVRQAALKNPHCPYEALRQVVSQYRKFDFNKPGSWSDNEVTKKEFELALQHPNMSGELILDLYKKKLIDASKLLPLAHKLSFEERKIIFDTATIKFPRSITTGTVQNIPCVTGNIVKYSDIIIEIDDEEGNTQKVNASVDGLVVKVCVKVGEIINAGEQIAQILVPKSQGSLN
ncbi:ATP-binding protein [Escherichia coli]|uniref:ATP-binding protein n=1 Tax=Escherichia coli TaxID=562 RepID=UPI00128F82B0|nr:AAA family ATPase [Escherichia coli]MQK02296.1 AAA family ATPase [Escherichia coli]NKD97041.1 AAA family ATPase [Escherichia coli]QIG09523.1 AAA family ATPase [Escherichia coli]QIG13792.1 AAA family ATPase [Escherichia coli]HAX5245499.1 AAA family ATPase [Escherichia coli]